MSWQPTDTAEQDWPRITPVVKTLIAINVVITFLGATIVQPSELESIFAFRSGPLAETWWSAFTYMFLHAGLWHLAMNMYTLWLFGPRLEHVWGSRSFALFYIWCGLGGAVFHALLGGLASMVGASAAIFGVMLAYAMHWPRDEIFFFGVIPMRVATLVLMLALLNLFMGYGAGAAGGGGVAYFAHLGGFAFAFLYLKKPQHVSIDQLRQRVSPAPDVQDDMTPRSAPKPSTRSRHRDEVDEVVAQSKAAVAKRPARVAPGKKVTGREDKAEELDRVLDKISKHGLASLTSGERKLLDDMSKQLRDQ
jgi:membrane associated rhomboid family serine protease